jgi:MoaA/NifB/PqqE/SkfB family radical SAM enzyme
MFDFVDIETTSYCNAKCPFCNRTNMEFEKKHLDIEIIKKLPFNDIRNILLLGNKGDVIFYPKLFKLLEWIMNNSKTWFQIHTNASAHSKEWWSELAVLLKDRGTIVYALDGLENTHNLHRIGTNFDKIIENVTAFNQKGGISICQFLKFKHNEHQVDEIKKLVKSIGTNRIWIRKSRSFNDNLLRPDGIKTRHEINQEKNTVKCVFIDKPSFVLTVDGEIRPCCFMADDDYVNNFGIHLKEDIKYPKHLIEYLRNPKSINLYFFSFVEIMNSSYYKAIKKNYKHLFRCNQKCKATFEDIVDEEEIGEI